MFVADRHGFPVSDERLVIANQFLWICGASARIDRRAEVQVADDEDLLDIGEMIRESPRAS